MISELFSNPTFWLITGLSTAMIAFGLIVKALQKN